jgi:hypothetical protein
MTKYNLGCGNNKLEDFINVDKEDFYKPDLIMDLEVFPWDIKTSSADKVVLIHVLEHLGKDPDDFLNVMKELYRITRPFGEIEITVPHPLSYNFIVDPTHVTRVTPETLNMFSKDFCDLVIKNKMSNTTFAYVCNVDFEISNVSYVYNPQVVDYLISRNLIPKNLTQDVISNGGYDKMFPNLVDQMTINLIVKK